MGFGPNISLLYRPQLALDLLHSAKPETPKTSLGFHCASLLYQNSPTQLVQLLENAVGIDMGVGRAFRRQQTSSLDILSSKRAPRDYYKGKNCKPTGFHTRKGGYVVVPEKLPNYIVPDLTDFKLKPYISQCPREVQTTEASEASK